MIWTFMPSPILDFVPSTVSRLSFGRDDLARFDLEHYTMLLERTPVLPAVYLTVTSPRHIEFKGPDGVLAIARQLGRTELFAGVRCVSEEAETWLFSIHGVRRVDESELARAWQTGVHLIMFDADVSESTLRRIGLDFAQMLQVRLDELESAADIGQSEPELEVLARGVVVKAATPSDDATARSIISFIGRIDAEIANVASYNGLRWPIF